MLQPVVIDGIRTPIGKLNGAMKDIQPEEIAAFLLQKICERSHFRYQTSGCSNFRAGKAEQRPA